MNSIQQNSSYELTSDEQACLEEFELDLMINKNVKNKDTKAYTFEEFTLKLKQELNIKLKN